MILDISIDTWKGGVSGVKYSLHREASMARRTSFLTHLLLSKREKKRPPPLPPLVVPARICAHAAQGRPFYDSLGRLARQTHERHVKQTSHRERTDQITRTPVKMRPDFGDATLFEASGCSKIFLTSHSPDVTFHVTLVFLRNAASYRSPPAPPPLNSCNAYVRVKYIKWLIDSRAHEIFHDVFAGTHLSHISFSNTMFSRTKRKPRSNFNI